MSLQIMTEGLRKETLLKIAQYEKRCLDFAFAHLEKSIDQRTRNVLRVFVNVTNLYGQIYLGERYIK